MSEGPFEPVGTPASGPPTPAPLTGATPESDNTNIKSAGEESFFDKTNDIEDDCVDLLKAVIRNEEVKLVHRLKAADMILSRRVPELRSVEIKNVVPVQINYVSIFGNQQNLSVEVKELPNK